ncbi:esterase family protein [Thalassobacillus sp. C254]|uniref:alpha/beta hydrolase n=1 Tax=Thalassobacillus sp. C254 TaxID=1225341 RepID=UPI0006D11260|nr:alpha/beta hydrolase-fold protein [Thalassobacillus sp. C254]
MITMKGQMKALTFTSEILETTFDLHVYLPPNYNPLYTYHLVIAQDGRDYFQLGKIGRKVEAVMEEGARETIVIGVPYPSVEMRRVWYHPDSEDHKKYIQFLVKELLPFLDDQYQTWSLPHGRTLMGDSLAATVSLMAALEYPNTFSRVMMHSPFVNETVLNAVRENQSWNRFEIYHTIGSEETNVKTTDGSRMDFLTPNRELNKLLAGGKARYYYHEFNGGHFWKDWEKDLPEALRFMFTLD